MGRAVILSNNRLCVGLDETGLVHDFYYPYVGLDNLTTARSMHHKIGVWVDSHFSWVDSDLWQCEVNLSSDAMVSQSKFVSSKLEIEIYSEDFVDYELDFFGRKITVVNRSKSQKEVRLFMHQVFEISRQGRADTAIYVPEDEYILDYKGQVCLLMSGKNTSTGKSFDSFAVGNYGIEGKSGTYMDAEDGELSRHAVEHGGVDSVIMFEETLSSGSQMSVNYWVVASDSQTDCEELNDQLKTSFESRLQNHKNHWQKWLARSSEVQKISPKYQNFVKRSLLIIKAHCDIRGGIIASADSSIYNYGRDYYSYVWPRDGAYAVWPLIRLGYFEEAKAFLNFCADVAHKNGYLNHKYQPDRAIGSTWHPLLHGKIRELAIQEDETAIAVIMLSELYAYSNDKVFTKDIFDRFVVKATNFLSDFIDDTTSLPHASYDLWEEKFLTSTYTTALVYRALIVASELADELKTGIDTSKWLNTAKNLIQNYPIFINPDDGSLRKGFYLNSTSNELHFDNTLDVSNFYGPMVFGFHPKDDQAIASTINQLESYVDQYDMAYFPRYSNDNYFRLSDQAPPNIWLISSLWVAQYYIRANNNDKAIEILDWVKSSASNSGCLAEQIDPTSKKPISVMPLVWSHAEFINTVLDLTHKK